MRRHLQIHNRVENYNPRQRKLRNLIVVEAPAAGQDQADEAESVAQPDSGSMKDAEQESFGMDDVMEVLVTDTFPIQSDMVVELQGDGKA